MDAKQVDALLKSIVQAFPGNISSMPKCTGVKRSRDGKILLDRMDIETININMQQSSHPPTPLPAPTSTPSHMDRMDIETVNIGAVNIHIDPPLQSAPLQPAPLQPVLSQCLICWDALSSRILLPCMHLCVCATCAPKMSTVTKCPKCRQRIRSIKKVYF